MPPGANGLTGPAYVRWKAEQRWKRALARLDASLPAPDVSGLGPCSACGTTDIAARGWLGDPVHGTCVPCDKGRREAAERAQGAAARPVPRVVTAVPDTYRRERLGFSVEVIEDVKVGEKVTIRQESGQITLLHEVIQVEDGRALFRQAWRVTRERGQLADPWDQPTQRPPWTEAH